MFNIADYLKRVSGLVDNDQILKHEIICVVKKHTTIDLKSGDFDVKDAVVITNLSPLQRNILVIKKSLIIGDLKDFGVLDIR